MPQLTLQACFRPKHAKSPAAHKAEKKIKRREESTPTPGEKIQDRRDGGLTQSKPTEREGMRPDATGLCQKSLNGEDSGISAYERARLQNIKRNYEQLLSLGFDEDFSAPRKLASAASKTSARTPKRVRKIATEPGMRRRSTRLQKISPAADANSVEGGTANQIPSEELSFSPSAILNFDGSMMIEDDVIYTDTWLKKIYTMDWHAQRPLVLAAGHGGRAAVFGVGKPEPLQSLKVAQGWVAAAQFVPASGVQGSTEEILAVTASNDGALALWDIGKQCEQTPRKAKLVSSTNDLHHSGIFSMHIVQDKVCTGGKDKRVVYSTLSPSGDTTTLCEFDTHEGVVKSVRLRDASVLASTGNDRNVHIFDARTKAKQVSIVEAHPLAVNSVRWHPSNDHLLLTSSFSPELCLFDLRKPDAALHVYRDHFPKHVSRTNTITHPVFLNDGEHFLATGVACTSLAVYHTEKACVVDCGDLGINATALATPPDGSHKVLVGAGSSIHVASYKLSMSS
eukprot:CAMPEP_0184545832 /NCGR_PEP_ID=MMETSP0199_2-20130426/4577_1 /TAXON_ID=1112570 /ORGANISM="Thraustochytrium sp., Strain LLF1b" /LENGTH=509 /DNA_ID=CAMNT_0026940179 /DNA_START=30 /DNA_END=1559 /DNA_ORIENTATION=-